MRGITYWTTFGPALSNWSHHASTGPPLHQLSSQLGCGELVPINQDWKKTEFPQELPRIVSISVVKIHIRPSSLTLQKYLIVSADDHLVVNSANKYRYNAHPVQQLAPMTI